MHTSQAVTKQARVMGDMPRDPKDPREPLQFWGCGGHHMHMNYPHENGYVKKHDNI